MLVPNFCVVLVNYHGVSVTLACIQSLKVSALQANCDLSIIVVDNSGEFPVGVDSSVTVLKTGQNIGLAGAWYIGQYNLVAQSSDYLVFLNNDTHTDVDFFSEVVRGINKWGSKCAFGPRILFASEPNKIWSRGGSISKYSASVKHSGEGVSATDVQIVDFETGHLSGCCLIVKTTDMNAIGGVDTNFFFRGEEWDINYRLSQLGIKLVLLDSARLYHAVNGSHDRFELKMLYLAYRAKVLFAKKIQPFWYFPVWLLASLIYGVFVAPVKFSRLSGVGAQAIRPVLLSALIDGIVKDKIRIEDYGR